jgi:hypothetical protein
VFGVIVAMAALAGGGIAIADGLGVFGGISAVQHPQTTGDVIDPATEAYIERKGCTLPGGHPCAPMISGLQFDTARHLGQLQDGQNIYLIVCGQTYLCTVVGPPHAQFEVHSPLSASHPSTIGTYLANDHHLFTFGVALDGATSVSFDSKQTADGTPTGPQVTVPVNNNFWIYEGPAGDPLGRPTPLLPLTVHFADGTTATEPAAGGGTNCAAC